jgi:hypothetical protein
MLAVSTLAHPPSAQLPTRTENMGTLLLMNVLSLGLVVVVGLVVFAVKREKRQCPQSGMKGR